ncbi:glycosyl transferase [Leptolyngbya iicbica]|uniref:Glycosyl transferase n=2 Tax=Cyanophyceae TaxID=3028117 RepID=A0A4Q7EFP6_9CYAN|nr:glycosyl transferase [Leptolyngbya sp. LK]RZM82664.1 glycosyl transferase [Leptolyngbya sp. LK]
MSAKTLYVAITNHGFGHATRATAVAATVKQHYPEVNIILATKAPRWLLSSYFEGLYQLREVAVDIGVLQQDSLVMDKPGTLAALKNIRDRQAELVDHEAAFLQAAGVDLVLGDIPPLMAIAAKAANIPCWMMSNFGWDFIYRPWGGEFIQMADWIADCFAQCDRLFRLPFHEPMSAFPHIIDVGLTGGEPRLSETEARSRFQLTAPKERTILLTFGGLGIAGIPYKNLARFPDWQFITFDRVAPNLPNLRIVRDHTLRPVDFMPFCGRVVSKPGFSTFAEACRLDLPIVTVTRDNFAEGPVLVEAMKRHSYHQVMSPQALAAGDWDFLLTDPAAPLTDQRVSKTGNEDIADAIVNFFYGNKKDAEEISTS